jgi:hypothetical protein
MTTPSDHPLRAGLGLWAYTVAALAAKQLVTGYSAAETASGDLAGQLLHDPNLVACALGGALVATGWTLLLPLAPRIWALAITNLLVSALMVADLFYLRQAGSLISLADVMQQPQLLGTIADSVFSGIAPAYVLYFIDVLVILVAVRSRGPVRGAGSRVPGFLAGAAATLVGIMLIAPMVDRNAGATQTNESQPQESWPSLGVVPYHLLDLIHGRSSSSLNASDVRVVPTRLADRRRKRRAPTPLQTAPSEPPSIDADGLVFREPALQGRMQLELNGLTPLTLDCDPAGPQRNIVCDDLQTLETAQALLERSGRATGTGIAPRVVPPGAGSRRSTRP